MELDLSGNEHSKIVNKLKKIDSFIYETLYEILIDTVPEFKIISQNQNIDLEPIQGNYSFMNDFALILSENIKEDPSSYFVRNSLKFINAIGQTNNLEVLNLIKVGILEILYTQDSKSRDFIYDSLSQSYKFTLKISKSCTIKN